MNITAIYHKQQKVIEILRDNKQIADFIVDEPENQWFDLKLGKKMFFFNFVSNTLGLFETIKKDGEIYEIGDFIEQIKLDIK